VEAEHNSTNNNNAEVITAYNSAEAITANNNAEAIKAKPLELIITLKPSELIIMLKPIIRSHLIITMKGIALNAFLFPVRMV